MFKNQNLHSINDCSTNDNQSITGNKKFNNLDDEDNIDYDSLLTDEVLEEINRKEMELENSMNQSLLSSNINNNQLENTPSPIKRFTQSPILSFSPNLDDLISKNSNLKKEDKNCTQKPLLTTNRKLNFDNEIVGNNSNNQKIAILNEPTKQHIFIKPNATTYNNNTKTNISAINNLKSNTVNSNNILQIEEKEQLTKKRKESPSKTILNNQQEEEIKKFKTINNNNNFADSLPNEIISNMMDTKVKIIKNINELFVMCKEIENIPIYCLSLMTRNKLPNLNFININNKNIKSKNTFQQETINKKQITEITGMVIGWSTIIKDKNSYILNIQEINNETFTKCYYIYFNNDNEELKLKQQQILNEYIFTKENKIVISYNLKLQLNWLLQDFKNLNFKNICFDPLITEWLVDKKLEHTPSKNIKELFLKYFEDFNFNKISKEYIKYEKIINLVNYSIMSWFTMSKLYSFLNLYNDSENNYLFKSFLIECKIIPILSNMERHGIGFNFDNISHLEEIIEECKNNITKDIKSYLPSNCRKDIKLTNSNDVSYLLYDVLKMEAPKKTTKKQVKSTDKDSLRKLIVNYPHFKHFIDQIQLFRKIHIISTKGSKSFFEKFVEENVDGNSIICCQQEQNATATGRLTTKNPNLQAIPKPVLYKDTNNIVSAKNYQQLLTQHDNEEIEINVRACIVPINEKKYILVSGDFSQIEVRLIAHLSQDKTLNEILQNEEIDIFKQMASKMFGILYNEVTDEQRSQIKTLTYGVIYGKGDDNLAIDLFDCKQRVEEAKKYRQNFFTKFKGIAIYKEQVENELKQLGFITTITGRKRYIPSIYSTDNESVAKAKRQSFNSKVQGSAADILKLAMIGIDDLIKEKELDCRLLLQIHDELLFEVERSIVHDVVPLIRKVMENAFPSLSVKTPVTMKVGENWGNMTHHN
ncbi:hypothetical protein ABK040_005218 [Willaertia magna]